MSKVRGKPFQKGQSGNPGGRPKEVGHIRELARQHTEQAIYTLAEICKDTEAPQASRVAAANSLLDRGYGKPTQYVEEGANPLEQMSIDEKRSLLSALEAIEGDAGTAEDGASPLTH